MTTNSQPARRDSAEETEVSRTELSRVVGDEGGGGISAGGAPGATSGAGLGPNEATKAIPKKVDLYHKADCPFSARVRDFISLHDIDDHIAYHDIDREEGARERLKKLSGRERVPCLIVDGRPIHESDIINDWLDMNYVKRDSTAAA